MKNITEYIIDQIKEEISYKYKEINESGGLYKGQIELATFLTDNFFNNIKDNITNGEIIKNFSFDELKFENIFFDSLKIVYHIDVKRKNISGESSFLYYDNNTNDDKYLKFNYNINTKRLKLIIIDIYTQIKGNNLWDYLRGRICHELNHCYTYYDIISDDLKENENGDIKIPDEYNSILHKWKDESYDKIIKNINNEYDIAKKWSLLLIYSLTRYERNAFLAEIDSYLFGHGSKLKHIDNIDNILSNCKQYNIYKDETFKVINIIKNDWSDNQKQILVDLYNTVYNTNKSFKRIIYLLKSKNEQTIDKLNKNIKSLVNEYDIMKEGKVNFEGYLSYFKTPMTDYLEWF